MRRVLQVMALVVTAGLSVSCNPSSLSQSKGFIFVRDLSVGVYEYNAHTLNIERVFNCASESKTYCEHLFTAAPSQTMQVFEKIGWTSEKLKTFLQDESYDHYKDQKTFHMMIFLFQSGSQDYVRIVNRFTQTVTTLPLVAGNSLDLDQLFSHEQIFYIRSKPTLADVHIAQTKLAEAPLWVYLDKGVYDLKCELPGQVSQQIQLTVPGEVLQECVFIR